MWGDGPTIRGEDWVTGVRGQQGPCPGMRKAPRRRPQEKRPPWGEGHRGSTPSREWSCPHPIPPPPPARLSRPCRPRMVRSAPVLGGGMGFQRLSEAPKEGPTPQPFVLCVSKGQAPTGPTHNQRFTHKLPGAPALLSAHPPSWRVFKDGVNFGVQRPAPRLQLRQEGDPLPGPGAWTL